MAASTLPPHLSRWAARGWRGWFSESVACPGRVHPRQAPRVVSHSQTRSRANRGDIRGEGIDRGEVRRGGSPADGNGFARADGQMYHVRYGDRHNLQVFES